MSDVQLEQTKRPTVGDKHKYPYENTRRYRPEHSGPRANQRSHSYDSEDEPFGNHGVNNGRTTLGDIDDDIGHAVFVSWIGVAATFAGVGIVGLLIRPRPKTLEIVSDCFIAVAAAIMLWALFVFFYFRHRHWTTWLLGVILVFAIGSLIALACI